jgi:hypothetical protein
VSISQLIFAFEKSISGCCALEPVSKPSGSIPPPLFPPLTRVTYLELPQHLHLLLFLACRFSQLFLPLIIHHFLHHPPCLPIQITQLTIFRHDLGGIDLRGSSYNVGPPFHLIRFVKVDIDCFTGVAGKGCKCPGGFVRVDGVGKLALRLNGYFESR